MTNYDGMIGRKLMQAKRLKENGNADAAAKKFDEAWSLMQKAGRENLKEETVRHIEWVRENYHTPLNKRLARATVAGYRAEGRILARQESQQEYYE